MMMTPTDPELLATAEDFAGDIADLLDCTVADAAPVRAQVSNDRIVVGTVREDGGITSVPLKVQGEYRLGLRLHFQCQWDFARRFLAVHSSAMALTLPRWREPLIRFDYLESHTWSPAHVQIHAESSALGWLHALTGTSKPPKVQELHIPVGGKRMRPSVEDVVEFAIKDLAVDAKDGAHQRIEEGRSRWRRRQVLAAIRDVVKDDPISAPAELHQQIDQAVADVGEHG